MRKRSSNMHGNSVEEKSSGWSVEVVSPTHKVANDEGLCE
jgi:hypothetical protein